MSFRFEHLTDDLMVPVCGAFRQVFGDGRSPQAWQHIYRDAPDGSISVVALDQANEVAGFFGGTIHRITGPMGSTDRFAQMRDVFTRPAARSAGIRQGSLFARLGRVFLDRTTRAGVSVLFGFGSERHVRLGKRLLGYECLTRLQAWEFDVPLSTAAPAHRIGALSVVPHFGADVEALWGSRPNNDVSMVVRDKTFLDWRFSERSGKTYTCCRYDSIFTGGMAGYAVLARDGQDARLVDFFFPVDPELRHDMWRQLVVRLSTTGVRNLALLASHANQDTGVLASLGCRPSQVVPPWCPACMSLVPGRSVADLGAVFHMTMADGDIF